jgi:hypothetical protein
MPHAAFQYCDRGCSQSTLFAWMMLSSPPQAVVQGSASHVGTAGT